MGRRRTAEPRPAIRRFAGIAGLPPEGVAWLNTQCELRSQGVGPTARALLEELQRRWGIVWNDTSIGDYQAFYESQVRIEAQAHEEGIALAKYFLDRGPEAAGDLSGIIEHARLAALTRMGEAEPVEVFRTLIAHDRSQQAKEKLGLERDKKALQDEKLALDRARLELERERKLAIDKPGLFLEFFKGMVETLVQTDPAAAEVLNRHFDRLMAKVKGASA
jgi:hypothetical protein